MGFFNRSSNSDMPPPSGKQNPHVTITPYVDEDDGDWPVGEEHIVLDRTDGTGWWR
jgi:hypothetical protein